MKNELKITQKSFTTFKDLEQSAKNWEHSCTYQLTFTALHGEHKVIELPNMQISYSKREGGMIHEVRSPKESISVALITACKEEACFSEIKLHVGDILFFDDTQAHIFMSKSDIASVTISINKEYKHSLINRLYSLQNVYIKDSQGVLAKLLMQGDNSQLEENLIISTLQNLVTSQEAQTPKLTKGELVSLDILHQMYQHMDKEVNIKTLANHYGVSQKTLQNSFKSLFGFTPKIFLRLLKLNLVHNELKNSVYIQTTVLQVATKWGFKHMGSFSRYYTQLFGENPSITLKNKSNNEVLFQNSCVKRQEEI